MSRFASFALVLILCGPTFAQKPVAQLPKTYINTTWAQPTGGTLWAAHTSAQLASALSTSQPGDVIVLDAGATYTGYFQLPAKSNPNNKWIYVVSSAISKLPTGKRVSPADTVNMAKVVTPNTAAAFQVNGGANHWRFAGIEITSASRYVPSPNTSPNGYTYFLVGSQSHPVPLPDSITIDRCYIHGSAGQDVVTGVQGTASSYAVVDSYISEIHAPGQDSQAFASYDSPGPFKVVNNYLEAAGENIMFGGSGANNNRGVPSDIEIRNNYLFKPLTWAKVGLGGTISPGNQWVEKNAFELKSAQRVLFDGNLIENVWMAGQMGFAIVLTVRSSQSGDFAVVNDVTITNNVLKNVVSGVNTLAKDDQCGLAPYTNCKNAGSQARWNIANNLILFYDPTRPGGGRNLMLGINPGTDRINNQQGVLRDVVFQHNTAVPSSSVPCWNSIYFSTGSLKPPISNLTYNIWILDNSECRQPTGDWGLQGTTGLTQYMGSPAPLDTRYKGNVMYVPTGDRVQTFPLHNYASPVPFTYEAPSNTDYQLLTPYWTDTSDARLAGIDNVSLRNALASGGQPLPGVIVPSASSASR
jgi:hypothetical protein